MANAVIGNSQAEGERLVVITMSLFLCVLRHDCVTGLFCVTSLQ